MTLLRKVEKVFKFFSFSLSCNEICLAFSLTLAFYLHMHLKLISKKRGSIANVAAPSTKYIEFAKSSALEFLFPMFLTFLFHFSLMFSGNFDSTKHIFCVPYTFQFYQSVTFLYHFSLMFSGNFDSTKHIFYVPYTFQFYQSVAISHFRRAL